ncbi:MAG TPA: DUF1566 domain-containing protein [Myxococcales bacterium]|jgi:hypothetical protein
MGPKRSALAPWALALVAAGCFVPASTTGLEGQECFPNATCMGTLSCEAGVCVARPTADASLPDAGMPEEPDASAEGADAGPAGLDAARRPDAALAADASVAPVAPDAAAPDASARDGGGAGFDAAYLCTPDTCGVDCEWARSPVPPESPTDYTIGDGIVTDNVTGLVWQRAVPEDRFTWSGAKAYCSCLVLGGQTGWRLPSLVELLSIVDSAKADPSINTHAFPNTPVEYYWTSVPYAPDPTSAWFVYFSGGTATADKIPNYYWVRCVR